MGWLPEGIHVDCSEDDGECHTFPKLLLPSSSPFLFEKPDSSFPVSTSLTSSVTDLNCKCSCSEGFWLTHLGPHMFMYFCYPVVGYMFQPQWVPWLFQWENHSSSSSSIKGQCGLSDETSCYYQPSPLFLRSRQKNFMLHALNLSTTLQCPSLVKLCLLFIPRFPQQRLTFFSWPCEGRLSIEMDFLSAISWLREVCLLDVQLVDTNFSKLQGCWWGLLLMRSGCYTGVSSLTLSFWQNCSVQCKFPTVANYLAKFTLQAFFPSVFFSPGNYYFK